MGMFEWIQNRLWHCNNKHCRELRRHIEKLRCQIRSMCQNSDYRNYNDGEGGYNDDDDEYYDDDDDEYYDDDNDEYYDDDDDVSYDDDNDEYYDDDNDEYYDDDDDDDYQGHYNGNCYDGIDSDF